MNDGLTIQRYEKTARIPNKSANILVKVQISLYNFIQGDNKRYIACIFSKIFVTLQYLRIKEEGRRMCERIQIQKMYGKIKHSNGD